MKQIEDAMVWLVRDVQLPQPTLTNGIFSGRELSVAMGEEWERGMILEVMRNLEIKLIVNRTNKVGPDGDYFNIHPRVYEQYHPVRADRIFVRDLKLPEEGFCIINATEKTYRNQCAGRNCRFYLAHEKQCVKQNFFIK